MDFNLTKEPNIFKLNPNYFNNKSRNGFKIIPFQNGI